MVMAYSNTIGRLTYNDYYRLAAYEAGLIVPASNGNELAQQLMFGGGILGGGALALQGGAWLYSNKGNYRNAWSKIGTQTSNAKVPEKLLKGEGFFKNIGNRYQWQRMRDMKSGIPEMPKILFNEIKPSGSTEINPSKFRTNPNTKVINQSVNNMRRAQHYNLARKEYQRIEQLVREGKLKGADLRKALKNVDYLMNKAKLEVLKDIKAGRIAPSGMFNGFFGKVAQKTGWNKVKRGVLNWANKGVEIGKDGKIIVDTSRKAVATRMAGKGAKAFIKGGGPITFAVELAAEAPEIVETYKKLGTGKGTKQLAKSTVTAGASAAGWVVGAKVGAIGGAKVGGLIGSIFGPVGTGIGAAIGGALGGIIGGIAGSWAAGKGAKAVVGKSELEKAKKKQVIDTAREAKKSKQKAEELAAKVEKKAEEEGGCDDKAVLKAYDKLISQNEQALAQAEEQSHAGNIAWDGTSQTVAQQNGPDFSKELNILNNLSNLGSNKSYSQNSFTMNPFSMNPFAMNNPFAA